MINEQTVTKIAKLARIKIADGEKAHYASEISTIINWLEQLNEVDTKNVPLLTSVASSKLPQRKDEITDGDYRENVLANAPKHEFDCFVVPKVVDQG